MERINFQLTPWGSLIESAMKVKGVKLSDGEFVKRLKKAQLPYLDDNEFLPKTFKAFGFDISDFKGIPIGLYKDEQFNTAIFSPVAPITFTDEEGIEKQTIMPVPITKGFIPQTVAKNIHSVQLINL